MGRVSSGVEGLDEMLYGGFIPERSYLIAGGPGAGKTIFCMQYLMEGIQKNEKGLYIALEEPAHELRQDMQSFGWDIQRIKILNTMQDITSGMWSLKAPGQVGHPEFNLKTLVKTLRDIMGNYQPKRIVLDSLTSLKVLYGSESHARRELLAFINYLESTGATTLITSELLDEKTTMEEFLTSGVIKLHLIENEGERINALSVQKMRGSNFDKHMRPLKITEKGIRVFNNESVFS
jgi:KaiC/GvpD/RAD55 family RecA-like ATPase